MEMENKQEIRMAPKNKGENEEKGASLLAVRPLAEMERLLDRMMGQSWPFVQSWKNPLEWSKPWFNELFDMSGMRLPSVDVIDRDEEIFVRAEVPGVEKKGLEISLLEHALTIKGRVRQEEQEEKGDYHWREITSSEFSRTVNLPADVDASKVSAVLKNGILEITLPKMEISKRHSIAIQEQK